MRLNHTTVWLKAPSILATMSKQHCRTPQVERFFRQCRMLLRQSRTLLRHCCWCGRGLTANTTAATESVVFVFSLLVRLQHLGSCRADVTTTTRASPLSAAFFRSSSSRLVSRNGPAKKAIISNTYDVNKTITNSYDRSKNNSSFWA